jgi:hypothetical protein
VALVPIPASMVCSAVSKGGACRNASTIPNFGADTFYPAPDRYGRFMTGFDDGGIFAVSVGSSSPTGFGSTTGAAIVSGNSWRNLSVHVPAPAIVEDGYPMLGRYTSANAVINGTWWTGTYGLGLSHQTNSLSIEIGPFVGFRFSISDGRNWSEPSAPDGSPLNVSHNLFKEHAAAGPPTSPVSGHPAGIKFGSPHVVDHGPENKHSPDGALYLVAGGCLSDVASENCTWISGDGIFVARANAVDASAPNSLNDASIWQFFAGGEKWASDVSHAKPAFTWRGRVGAVTATWHPTLRIYFLCVTAPHTHAWANEGPYDTYILQARTITGPFQLVSYMPKFGQQAYFVSLPSAWMGNQNWATGTEHGDHDDNVSISSSSAMDAVLTFSANFACKIEGCAPNIFNAGYGANLLPIRFVRAKTDEGVRRFL